MFDLVSMGELLIDFTPRGISAAGNPLFEQNPGGGPANLACAAAKMGCKVSFIGKVGNDVMGSFLKRTLVQNQVDTRNLLQDAQYKTTLAFVHLDESGDRSFSFYRENGADTMLRFSEIDLSLLKNCRYFFFSSVLMAQGASRETSFQVARYVKSEGIPVIFDPNLRFNLWNSAEDAKSCICRALAYADIVKVSEEELVFLTGENDCKKATEILMNRYPVAAVFATLGAKGCYARTAAGRSAYHPGFAVHTVDTTAAGDSFTGGLVRCLSKSEKPIAQYSEGELKEAIRFANAVGALTTTKPGAISAMPGLHDVETLLARSI